MKKSLAVARVFASLFVTIALVGCATNTGMATFVSDDALADKIKSSPIIKLDTSVTAPKVESNVELYYHNFQIFGTPSRIINWEYYYKIGEYSEPAWKYKVIGDIELWCADMVDEKNIPIIKAAAAKSGADGIIGLFRKPINTSSQQAPPAGQFSLNEFAIGGYLYYGKLVAKDAASK